MLKKTSHATQKKGFSHHGKEILHGYAELLTNKKARILQPRNRNSVASSITASFHFTKGLL